MERFSRHIGGDNVSVTAEELEIVIKANVTDAIKKLEGLKGQIQKTMSKTVEPMQKVNTQVAKTMSTSMNQTSKAMGTTASKMDIVNREIDLQTKKVAKLRQEMQKYNDAQKKMSAKAPVSVKGKYDAKAIESYIGNTASLGKNVKLPKDVTEQLKKAEIRLDKLKLSAQKTAEQMDKKLTPALKKTSKTMKETKKDGISVTKIFKRMAVSMVVGRVIRGAINQAIAGIGDLAKFSDRFNGAMSEIQSSFLWLRNSMTTALTPIIEGLAPVITKITDALSELFITITMYTTALFTNSKTYIRAKKVTTDYAKSLDGVAKAQQRALAGFDELNVLAEQNGTGMPTAGEMFEEVAIPEKVLNNATKIKQVYEELKPILIGLAGLFAALEIAEEVEKIKEWIDKLNLTNDGTIDLNTNMEEKNGTLKEQTKDTQKETSSVWQWVAALGGAGVAIWGVQKGLSKLKQGFPLGMPTGEVGVFAQATESAGVAFHTLAENSREGLQVTAKNLGKFTQSTSERYARWCKNLDVNTGETLTSMFRNFKDAFINIGRSFSEFMRDVGAEISSWFEGNPSSSTGSRINKNVVNITDWKAVSKGAINQLGSYAGAQMSSSAKRIGAMGVSVGLGSLAPRIRCIKIIATV